MVFACDFDGTLCFSRWPNLGEPNMELIQKLIDRKKRGDKIILWTCRNGQPLEDAILWSKKYGLIFDAINDNLPESIAFFGSNSRKINCDYYIDDKSINPNAFLVCKEIVDNESAKG